MKKISLCLLLLLFGFCVNVYPFVVKIPHSVDEGSGFWVEVKKSKREQIKKVEVSWMNKKFLIVPHNRSLNLLFGVGINDWGKKVLKVGLVLNNGNIKIIQKSLRVKPKRFPKRILRLPSNMVFPSKKILKKIVIEQKIIERLLEVVNLKRYYTRPFVCPVRGKVISGFGVVRILNGKKRSIHKGVDFKVSFNTPVRSSNYGRVVFVGDHYFGGKTIIVDHGLGVFTIYMHLNKILVKKGKMVKRGSIIGLSGMSGRATGPHLHFGVSVFGKRIDPLSVVKNY